MTFLVRCTRSKRISLSTCRCLTAHLLEEAAEPCIGGQKIIVVVVRSYYLLLYVVELFEKVLVDRSAVKFTISRPRSCRLSTALIFHCLSWVEVLMDLLESTRLMLLLGSIEDCSSHLVCCWRVKFIEEREEVVIACCE